MRPIARTLLVALLGLAGCQAPAPAVLPPSGEQAPAAPRADPASAAGPTTPAAAPVRLPSVVELPPGWATVPLTEFSALLEQCFPAGEARTFPNSAFEELGSALRTNDPLALRAALLLARCSDVRAGELCVARLERRAIVAEEDPLGYAVDLCLAAALRGFAGVRELGSRLESLSFGRRPHPDLEVRVECGATAFALGRDKPLAFLLSILKHGTRLWAPSSGWKPLEDMSFCQRRAAEALCQRAGRPCRYRALLSLDEREDEIRLLEAALSPARPKP